MTGRGAGVWLAEQLGSPTRLRTHATTEDMEALLAADVNVADGRAVSAVALARGLHLPAATASKFGEAVLADQRAWEVVEEAGYFELLEQLRTRAELRPPATLPERGMTIGSTALPAPQPALAAAVQMEQVALPPAPAPAAAPAGGRGKKRAARKSMADYTEEERALWSPRKKRRQQQADSHHRRRQANPEKTGLENQARSARWARSQGDGALAAAPAPTEAAPAAAASPGRLRAAAAAAWEGLGRWIPTN